jgi:hypothetical protein
LSGGRSGGLSSVAGGKIDQVQAKGPYLDTKALRGLQKLSTQLSIF